MHCAGATRARSMLEEALRVSDTGEGDHVRAACEAAFASGTAVRPAPPRDVASARRAVAAEGRRRPCAEPDRRRAARVRATALPAATSGCPSPGRRTRRSRRQPQRQALQSVVAHDQAYLGMWPPAGAARRPPGRGPPPRARRWCDVPASARRRHRAGRCRHAPRPSCVRRPWPRETTPTTRPARLQMAHHGHHDGRLSGTAGHDVAHNELAGQCPRRSLPSSRGDRLRRSA